LALAGILLVPAIVVAVVLRRASENRGPWTTEEEEKKKRQTASFLPHLVVVKISWYCLLFSTSKTYYKYLHTSCFLEEIRLSTLVMVGTVVVVAAVVERQGPMSIPPSYTRHLG
jgi:hypothetical protein